MKNSFNGRWGWILIGLLASTLLLCVVGTASVYTIDRRATFYPNSNLITSNSKVRLPDTFRWDEAYSTTDPYNVVFSWYSNKFNLGPESAANGACAMAEDSATVLLIFDRYTGVMICETGDERLVYINRTTFIRR